MGINKFISAMVGGVARDYRNYRAAKKRNQSFYVAGPEDAPGIVRICATCQFWQSGTRHARGIEVLFVKSATAACCYGEMNGAHVLGGYRCKYWAKWIALRQ